MYSQVSNKDLSRNELIFRNQKLSDVVDTDIKNVSLTQVGERRSNNTQIFKNISLL